MVVTVRPFPDPEIPSIDAGGLMIPPWIKYPNLPKGSVGWRMGVGSNTGINLAFGGRDKCGKLEFESERSIQIQRSGLAFMLVLK